MKSYPFSCLVGMRFRLTTSFLRFSNTPSIFVPPRSMPIFDCMIGIVIDGKLLVGKNHIAGEWGHNVLKPDGDKCYCGKAGCVETVISGPALENRWEELAGEKMKLEEIIRVNERDGNDKYWVWKTHFINYFGKSLSMVINILDPDVIILGGGVANISFLYCEGAARVQNQVFSDACETPVIQNQLGDSAGVFGAALL